jgi:hypothetical protein
MTNARLASVGKLIALRPSTRPATGSRPSLVSNSRTSTSTGLRCLRSCTTLAKRPAGFKSKIVWRISPISSTYSPTGSIAGGQPKALRHPPDGRPEDGNVNRQGGRQARLQTCRGGILACPRRRTASGPRRYRRRPGGKMQSASKWMFVRTATEMACLAARKLQQELRSGGSLVR